MLRDLLQKEIYNLGVTKTSYAVTSNAVDCEQSLFCSRIRAGWTAKSREGDIRAASVPPTLLAARGSRLEYRTRFLAAPPAGILEQKRDCSQSSNAVTTKRVTGKIFQR